MRLGLDLDGVVYQWGSTARFLLEWHFGYQLQEHARWDELRESIAPEHWRWLWDEGVRRGLFRHGHLYKGSVEALAGIDRLADIVVITQRPEQAREDTLAWLAFHRIPYREIHLLKPRQVKSSVPCDVYLDDSPGIAQELTSHGLEVLLWDRPWNQGVALHRIPYVDGLHIRRVWSWADVLKDLRRRKIVEPPPDAPP